MHGMNRVTLSIIKSPVNYLMFYDACELNPSVWPFKWKLLSSALMWVLLIMLHTMILLLSLDIEQYFRVLHILLFKVVLS